MQKWSFSKKVFKKLRCHTQKKSFFKKVFNKTCSHTKQSCFSKSFSISSPSLSKILFYFHFRSIIYIFLVFFNFF
jgi:hypothetical protein